MMQRLALAVLLVASVAAGVFLRTQHPRESFCAINDELSELMPGLRVHALPLSNVRADIRENFFASLFYSPHGLGDAGYYYVASGVMAALNLPISDTNLWNATGVTCALLAVLIALLARAHDLPAMAIVGAALVAMSPLYLFASHTAFGRVVATGALQVATLVMAGAAVKHRSALTVAGLFVLTLILALGDGFFVAPVVVLYALALPAGTWPQRFRAGIRHPAVWAAASAMLLGLTFDVVMAVMAARRGAPLSLFGYLRIRAVSTSALSWIDLFSLLVSGFGKYLPVIGVLAVAPAWLFALVRSRTEPLAAALAAWLFIACAGVLRYYSSSSTLASVGGMTAYPLALPSYLLVAWALGTLMRSPGRLTQLALVATLVVLAPMAAQAATGKFDQNYRYYVDLYAQHRDQCLVVKAASVLVREDKIANATVFHLSDDVRLGMMGEFYYGLSYVGNHRTGERNRILDFGTNMVGHRYTPEELASAYGVEHFNYYVDFLTMNDSFTTGARARLEAAGAHVALHVTDGAREIGRVWSFDDRDSAVIDRAQLSQRWDARAQLEELFLQPLAGTSYHFGASWAVPSEK